VIVAGLREYDANDDGQTEQGQQMLYSIPTVR
jgi:hypothetical protein